MAAAGMLVAFALGVPLAVAIATRAPGYRVIVAALSSLRAIPDLTLAILAVVLLGLGPAAGIAALAVFYTAMVGRVFGDLFVAADAAPLEALRATGASRVAIAAFGLIPLTQPICSRSARTRSSARCARRSSSARWAAAGSARSWSARSARWTSTAR